MLSLWALWCTSMSPCKCTYGSSSCCEACQYILRIVLSTAPTIFITIESENATEGSQYTLICNVSGHESLMATVTYQWCRDSSTIQGPDANNTLHFNEVDRDDSGTYTCRVTVSSMLLNSNITAEESLKVTVIGKF